LFVPVSRALREIGRTIPCCSPVVALSGTSYAVCLNYNRCLDPPVGLGIEIYIRLGISQAEAVKRCRTCVFEKDLSEGSRCI